MCEQNKGREQTARNDMERVTIFRKLADEYLELIEVVGPVDEDGALSDRQRAVLSMRLMLERKFVTKSDKNTFLPKVFNALRRTVRGDEAAEFLDQKQDEYNRVISGESTGVSGSFNNVELDFGSIRDTFAYGRLMHSDRDKFVSAYVLEKNFLHLLVRQTKLLARLIEDIRDFIKGAIGSGRIPNMPDSLRETWLEVHDDPAQFNLGKRLAAKEIFALNDDGVEPLPGGLRQRTVSMVIPELGRAGSWGQSSSGVNSDD